MLITIFKRYDINGASTGDIRAEYGKGDSDPNSMWQIYTIIDMTEIEESLTSLEEECEDLTEQNRLLTLRIKELTENE